MKFATTIVVVVLTYLARLTTAQEEQKPTDVSNLEPTKSVATVSSFDNPPFDDRQWRHKRRTIINNNGEQFRVKVVKKPKKNSKVIHLYPIKKDERKNELQPKVQHFRHHDILVEGNANTKVEKMLEVSKYEDEEPQEMESHHYEEEHKEKTKIKIKHHHHHHHHNHVKTVVKKEPYPVEKIVPKPYPVEKIVEKIVHMPVEKIVHKPYPVPYPVEKIIEKVVHVPKPYPVKEYVEKKVPYPVEKVVEKVVEKIVPKYVHIPKPYPVIKHIHVPVEVKVPVPVEKKIYVPQKVEVEKKVPYPVKIYVPQPYPVDKKVPAKDHHDHYPNHHYNSMDDHHGYLEHKFHEETAASNDQHSLMSVQRHSISTMKPNERYHEQMKQFQREQQQLDMQHHNTQQQQDKLNEKFKTYKKWQQKNQYDQQQNNFHQIQMQQQNMERQLQHQIDQQKQLDAQSIHGHFGQKMLNDFAKPFYPTEHQHQSILTLQTHLLQDERYKPHQKAIPEFKPIANVRAIPIEQQPLQPTQQLYPVNIEGASSNVEPVALEPDNDTTDKSSFRINVAETEQLPKPQAFTMDAPYQYPPQTDYDMFQVYQIQPGSSFQTGTQQVAFS